MVLKLVTAAFYAVLILSAGWLIAGWFVGVAKFSLEKTRLDPLVRNLITSLIRPLVLIIAAMAAIDQFGVDLTAVVAILGAGAVAVGLALKDSLGNVAAGAMLLTLRPFHEGDFVEAGGEAGVVTGLGLFATSLKTAQGVLVTVPNNQVASSAIRNFTRNGLRRADIDLLIAADADPEKAQAKLLEVISADERVLAEPAPFVRITGLGPTGTSLSVAFWVAADVYAGARSDLIIACRTTLRKHKIATTSTAPVVLSASA